jgi:flagellar assembly protein FliH
MSKLVSGDAVAEFKRWQVPDVAPGQDGGNNRYLTAVQLEKIQKQAYDEAYARGLREGIAAGQAQMKDKTHRFVNLANALEKPLKEAGEAVERELLQLCLAVARQIVRREISLEPGQIVAVIREAVAALPVSTQKVQIRLHPEDAAVVRAVAAESQEDVTWKVVEDPSLSRGDCRIMTEYSQVDATLDRRLAAIAARLVGDERDHGPGQR